MSHNLWMERLKILINLIPLCFAGTKEGRTLGCKCSSQPVELVMFDPELHLSLPKGKAL